MTETADTTTMRAFAQTFFTRFGAEVYPGREDVLVDLPPELAEAFSKPRLYLTFADEMASQERELSPTEDILAYGSRTFDQMLALLAGRGEGTQLQFPIRRPTEFDLTLPFSSRRGPDRLVETGFETMVESFYLFHFRAVYTWTEKEDAFITVILDADGHTRPDKIEILTTSDVFPKPDSPPQVDPAILRRWFDRAAGITRRQVEARANALQETIRSRLQETIFRLNTFYGRLMDEIDSGDPAQDEEVRADLQGDLERKIADELERHHLRVTVSPISYAVALSPVAHHDLLLITEKVERELRLSRDLYSGQVEAYHCQDCGEAVKTLACWGKDRPWPGQCSDDCPLRQLPIAQGCLAVAAVAIETADAPRLDGVKAEHYRWRRLEDRDEVIYLGQRLGPAVLSPILGRVVVRTGKTGVAADWQKIGLWRRVGEMLRLG
jgi:hypothetical protein